ncbi:MAG TPA: phospho-N-acetylmuramoyl-pentapeptide-transferase [Abditibacteriaceae bacterium]|jgi:phospho-N-acetylmuramoyl-pentapeptide-transferase
MTNSTQPTFWLWLLQNTALWQIISFAVSGLLMLMFGGPLIAWLKNLRGMKWSAREDTPDTHLAKAGTPSMGGLGIISAATLTFFVVFLVNQMLMRRVPNAPALSGEFLLLLFTVPLITLAHLALGFADDWSKARGKGGLRARDKFLGQVVLMLAFFILVGVGQRTGVTSDVFVLRDASLPLLALLAVVIVGTCNAVNITDGIDGLAAGLCVQVGLAFALLGFFSADWWLCLAGACFGFLAFNRFPARVFMGDTGSLALGAALGAGAVLSRAMWLLPFVGFIFYVELLSVTAQVLWFKYTRKQTGEGKRLFRRAPLHHHFELGGWSEWRVVTTFWGINLITTLIGIVLWQNGMLPRFP